MNKLDVLCKDFFTYEEMLQLGVSRSVAVRVVSFELRNSSC